MKTCIIIVLTDKHQLSLVGQIPLSKKEAFEIACQTASRNIEFLTQGLEVHFKSCKGGIITLKGINET